MRTNEVRFDSRRVLLTLACLGGLFLSQSGFTFSTSDAWPCLADGGGWASTDGGCRDPNGVVWSQGALEKTGVYHTASGAGPYCINLVEGEQSDWRLPSKDEMQAAAAAGAGSHLNLSSIYDLPRWSSTTRGKNYRWVVNLGTGTATAAWTGNGTGFAPVVCVRRP